MRNWILALFLGTACAGKFEGTNTGNPVTSIPATSPITTNAVSLAQKVCLKINTCYTSITYQTCYDNVISLSNYTSELGTISITYSTLTALSAAETSGAVTANSTNSLSCQSAISALTCSDSLVQSAFSLTTPTDFTKTNYLFRASSSCTHIY